jgi:hypothetical protein
MILHVFVEVGRYLKYSGSGTKSSVDRCGGGDLAVVPYLGYDWTTVVARWSACQQYETSSANPIRQPQAAFELTVGYLPGPKVSSTRSSNSS